MERLNSRTGRIEKKDKIAVITELRRNYPLAALLEIAGIAGSSYCYFIKKLKSPDKYGQVKSEIEAIYHENQGRYGYRRITMELRNRGYVINHKTVQRLMSRLQLKCMVRSKKYQSYRGEVGIVAPDFIERKFQAEKPNAKWTTDITEFTLFGRKLYLSPILDMFNGELISCSISEHPVLKQVMDMLDQAFEQIPDHSGLILPSDQGWQYQHRRYQKQQTLTLKPGLSTRF